eukprot:5883940-Pleurochrysis_carterae.AAC.5
MTEKGSSGRAHTSYLIRKIGVMPPGMTRWCGLGAQPGGTRRKSPSALRRRIDTKFLMQVASKGSPAEIGREVLDLSSHRP